MFEKENIDNQDVVLVAVFGAFAVFVAIIVIQVVYYRMEKDDGAQKAHRVPVELTTYQTDQQTMLSSYRWTDKDGGKVAIPIERAMEKEREALIAAQRATP